MYLLAIDDLVFDDLYMEPGFITRDSERLGFAVRRREGIDASQFFGGSAEPARWHVAIKCPSVTAKDQILAILGGDIQEERRLLIVRDDVEETRVVTFAAPISVETRGETDLIVVFESSDSAWVEETTTTTRKSITNDRDRVIAVEVPGNVRAAPQFRISAIQPRSSGSSNVGWSKRVRYDLTNNADHPLFREAWAIDIGNTAALVSASKALASGNDLRLWIDGIEYPRTLKNWNTSQTDMWFVIPALPPGETMRLDVVYGNPSAGTPPTLQYPDLPAFDIATSTTALRKYLMSTAGFGGWYLSAAGTGATADFGVPGAWRRIDSLGNPNNKDVRGAAGSEWVSTSIYARMRAWRAHPDNDLQVWVNNYDGMEIYSPLGITKVRAGFLWTNINGVGRRVVIGRNSGSDEWAILHESDTTAATETTIAPADVTVSPALYHVAHAVWPDNYAEIPEAAAAGDYAFLRWNNTLEVTVDTTKISVEAVDADQRDWIPTDLGGTLTAWYQADAIGGISNNAALQQWGDSSGSNETIEQSISAYRPVYKTNQQNGLPVVEFAGNGYLWNGTVRTNAAVANSGRGMFLAVKPTTTGDANAGLVGSNNDGGIGFGIQESSGKIYIDKKGSGTASALSTAVATYAAWHILGAYLEGGNVNLDIDGTIQTTPLTQTFSSSASGITPGSLFSNTFAFGGQMGEIIITGSLTDDDVERIEGYLAHKWGLTANLPAPHPYKSVAPTALASISEADVYEVAAEIRLGGGMNRIPPYHALRLGNAEEASGAGVPRLAIELSETLVVDGTTHEHAIYSGDLTAHIEDVSAHVVNARIGWGTEDDPEESPTSAWVPLDPNRPVTANAGFDADIGGWNLETVPTGVTATIAYDGTIGGDVLGSLKMQISASTAASGSFVGAAGPRRFTTANRESVWVSGWMRTDNVDLVPELWISFFDEDDVFISSTGDTPAWTPIADEEARRVLNARVPDRATSYRVELWIETTGANEIGSVWLDDLRLNEADLIVTEAAAEALDITVAMRGRWF